MEEDLNCLGIFKFTLLVFACSLCLRWVVSNIVRKWHVASNPDKMNMCKYVDYILLKKGLFWYKLFTTFTKFYPPDMNLTSKELKFSLSGSRGFENCFPVPYKPELVRQRWLHSCVVLSGLDPDTKLAKIKMYSQGKLEKVLSSRQSWTLPRMEKEWWSLLGAGFDWKQSFAGIIIIIFLLSPWNV